MLQNIVKAGSAILDASNKEHWDQIQRTEGGTAQLLRNFEDYANTVAENMRKTYLKPFIIVTENMGKLLFISYKLVYLHFLCYFAYVGSKMLNAL